MFRKWLRRKRGLHAAEAAEAVNAGSRLHAQIAEIIDEYRPLIRADGGDIDLLGVSPDGTVNVRLRGACVGCPASFMTLQMGLEQRLRERIPEVHAVVNSG